MGKALTFNHAMVSDVAQRVIHDIAGPTATPRADQIDAVHALLVDRRRTLVVQRTGWGKSAVYWIAARAVRDAGGGLVLVISPLLALMRNQVESAQSAGLRAKTLNSSNISEWHAIEHAVVRNEVDILFISPERLANPRFEREVFDAIRGRLGLLVIDEAHCISSWGHDFRPDYQRIAGVLLANPELPILCTTATASARVTADIAAQLGPDTYTLRGQLARDSLQLSVISDLKAAEHFAWVADALRKLPGSGIIYTLTVEKVQRLTEFLTSEGHKVAAYFGAVPADERLRIEDDLMNNRLKAVVATSALGMGYDKPDLAFCIHVGCPGSPIDYYQQVGRAGRALDHATVALVTDQRADQRIWEWFATSNVPKPDEVDRLLSFLRSQTADTSLATISGAVGIARSRTELLLKILAVDHAILRTDDGWRTLPGTWHFDAEKYEALIASRRADAARMAEYARANTCLETQLRLALDDKVHPSARCGRCSVCTGTLPKDLTSSPAQESTRRAQQFLRGIDHIIEPRKQWPSGIHIPGLPMRNTRIAPTLLLEQGRALAYGDDATWAEALEAVQRDGAVTQTLAQGVTAVIDRWLDLTSSAPTCVVTVPSGRRPQLIASLAEHVAHHLDIPILNVLKMVPLGTEPRASGPSRASQVASRLTVAQATSLKAQHVLLVDDSCLSRWTLTLAGAHLRHAGASSIRPLVLHQLASGEAMDPSL